MLKLKQRITKNALFQRLLQKMCAKGQDCSTHTLDAYTTQWVNSISRGALYHIISSISSRLCKWYESMFAGMLVRCSQSAGTGVPWIKTAQVKSDFTMTDFVVCISVSSDGFC